jgi:hypothetical protein
MGLLGPKGFMKKKYFIDTLIEQRLRQQRRKKFLKKKLPSVTK